jgi:hypothetical protein
MADASGISFMSSVCTQNKYSVLMDRGFLNNLQVMAHELGHGLGAGHDGDQQILNGVAQPVCPMSNNNLMAPGWSWSSPTISNIDLFSNCSISEFKYNLLNPQLTGLSSNAQCLANVPTDVPVEVSAFSNRTLWTADEQCKFIFGPNATFCPVSRFFFQLIQSS